MLITMGVSIMTDVNQKILNLLEDIREELKAIRENMLDKEMLLAEEEDLDFCHRVYDRTFLSDSPSTAAA